MLNGSAPHKHNITDFKMTGSPTKKNIASTYNGTATITLKKLHLITVASVITLILASAATSSIVYGQTIISKAQNAPTNPASPPSHAAPPTTHMVEIVSPTKGEQVLVGKALLISGTSAGNTNPASINCQVSVNVNGIKPYQRATSTGPNGSDDYSKWNFTLIPKYTSIKPGQNKITAKYSCANSPSSFYNSVNVTGVTTVRAKVYEINLKVGYAHFISMPTSTNNKERQIKVIVNYTAAITKSKGPGRYTTTTKRPFDAKYWFLSCFET